MYFAVTASLSVANEASAHVVSRDALVNFQGGDFVYAVVDGVATPISVAIVARLGPVVAVEGPDISAGMSVVVDGNDRLRPGQSVEVVGQQ